jgi:hypothetical protein
VELEFLDFAALYLACAKTYLRILHISVHGLPMQQLTIHITAASLIWACSCFFFVASAVAIPAPLVQRAVLHSLQSIPAAAFPNSEMVNRWVPYRATNSKNACSFECASKPSPFDVLQSLRVVPPFTGYPRASSIAGDIGACGDDFDVCSQAFQVTLQVMTR